MEIVKRGSTGPIVKELQQQLHAEGYPVVIDGIFGKETYLAVCRLQQRSGLYADGIVGKDTWCILNGPERQSIPETPSVRKEDPTHPGQTLDFEAAAQILDIEVAAIRAVHEIESGGRSGFLKSGRPIILFEGHIFWKELKKRGINPAAYAGKYEDILFPSWNRSAYKGGEDEHDRLEKACQIHAEAALCATSWGMFQIMGFNHSLCGYDTVTAYVEAMRENQNNHLMAFVNFIGKTNLAIYLQRLDWETFAYRYNGPGYKQNQYDTKLRAAYLKFKNK